jgi:hypothetical protein
MKNYVFRQKGIKENVKSTPLDKSKFTSATLILKHTKESHSGHFVFTPFRQRVREKEREKRMEKI